METYAPNNRILYIDDEPGLLSSFASLMKKESVETHLLGDSTEIENVLKGDGPFAVVFSDQRMPGLDGVAALETVGRIHPSTIRILVTGYAEHADTLRAINVGGITHYVSKPWKDDELRRLTADCVARYNLLQENRFLLEEIAETNLSLRCLAEEHLRETEEHFEIMAENVEDLVAVVDCGGKLIYSSPSYRNILGDPRALKGTDLFLDIHPEDRERARDVFQEIIRTGVPRRIEYRLLAKDGSTRTMESKGGVIRDRAGAVTHGMVVSRDVTEERRLTAQFLRAQRMESIGTLAGGIAHDLNNVLAPIMMAIELLKTRVHDPGGQKLLATIESSARRGSDIVKQVLAFGRGVKGDRILVQLRHVVNEVVKISGETIPKSIEIRSDLPGDLWTVSADPTQMLQVLLNLVVNARDAMPGGGTLTLKAANVRLDEQYSRMCPAAKPGPYVSLAVTDTGTGIPPEIRETIFDPFFTTKEIGKGTGLGLSTTLAIVRSHEGFITLDSEVGEGTTFTILIPAADSAPHPAEAHEDADLPTGHGELILVIDDEAAIREITRETLHTYGYEVVSAGDGAEGVAVFAEHRNTIKAVITDIMMPVMDGTAAILALTRICPGTKIIAVSGLTSRKSVTAPSGSNVRAFLTKPYTAATLLRTLAAALR